MGIYVLFERNRQGSHHIENAINKKMQRTAKAGVD